METSTTGIRSAASSITRRSMPSYRAGAKASQGRSASSWASSWVNGRPLGVGTTSVGAGPSSGRAEATTPSSAAAHGSGFITMPGPPP